MLRSVRSNLPLLVVLTAAFYLLAALVATFIDGGGPWSRLSLMLLNPLCIAGFLALEQTPRLTRTTVFAIAGLQVVALVVDITLAALMAGGSVKGDWWVPASLASIPTAGIVYTLRLAGTLPKRPSR